MREWLESEGFSEARDFFSDQYLLNVSLFPNLLAKLPALPFASSVSSCFLLSFSHDRGVAMSALKNGKQRTFEYASKKLADSLNWRRQYGAASITRSDVAR
eukprot:3101421-Rhodomonas_salina.4